nr:SDR family NAD(P)-dependent oxidoreductase [Phreatobacter sp.]
MAIITGAARGIGRAMAAGFVAEGARVMIADRDIDVARRVAGEIDRAGHAVDICATDVTDAGAVEAMVGSTLARFGSIDVLVNNAGLLNARPLAEMPIEVWDEMIAVHLRGMFLCSRFAVPHMIARGRGSIINMSGSFGVSGAANFTHLSAAKAGMIGFTQALARELGPTGIRVNAIALAIIQTELAAGMTDDAIRAAVAAYPLRRAGTVDDVVPAAVFLASDEAGYFTGQTLSPSGGSVMVA